MKKLNYIALLLIFCTMIFTSCEERKTTETQHDNDTIDSSIPDSTVYGVCTETTSMHVLTIVTDDKKELSFLINQDDNTENVVKGGMFAGDRMAVTSVEMNGETVATNVINLNTLQGKWTSIDRNFEIVDGGDVISSVKSETNPYTLWKIHNGQLLFNRDTFDIITLGADTLEIENSKGIFVYVRK